MKKLALLDEKQQPHADTVALFLDKSVINRFKSINDYCKENKLSIDDSEQKLLVQWVEKTIYKQVIYYAHLMYHFMETSNDWGSPGEQQVNITFCRNLLKISPSIQLTSEHAKQFSEKVKTTISALNIDSLSEDDAKQKLRLYSFHIFGLKLEIFKATELNQFLKFSGSNKFLHAGQYGAQMEFIFGYGKVKKMHGYMVTFVEKEYIRTPNNVMSMAAIIGHQNIYIRLESLKTIFSQKWVQIFDYNEFDILTIHSDPVWNIAEGIKQLVLEKYQIDTKECLLEKEKTFINDMSETILYHEFGHGIIQQHILPFDLGAIGEATKIYGENIYTAILEFLADFSPCHQKLKGPIQNIIEISKNDRNRAQRMYLMYLSDTWFYNTDDEYMYTYSDLIVLILIRYLTPNDINFEALERDMIYTPGSMTSTFDRILNLYKNDMLELKTMCESASFSIGGVPINYPKIRELLIEEFRKNDGFVHVDSYEFMVPFWSNVLGYMRSSSNSKQIVDDFFKKQQTKIIKKILVLSCGKDMALNYEYDHRRYITDHMYKLNVLAVNPNNSE